MSTLVNKIVFHTMAEDEDASQRISGIYNAATEDQKRVVDDIFSSLTGRRLSTIIEGKDNE